MNAAGLALRMLRRDWRNGELRVLGFSLVLGVAAVSAVGFFTDRVQQAMKAKGSELLGADIVIESPNPLPDTLVEQIRARDVLTARTLEFPSVVLRNERSQLVQVKAVSNGYPLRGQLELSVDDDVVRTPNGLPPIGSLWIEPRLAWALDVEPGSKLDLGEAQFTIDRLLRHEPDKGGSLFQLAPRVLMRLDELPATGLLTPASRVRHRFLIAGNADVIRDLKPWLNDQLPVGANLFDLPGARPEMRLALDRGGLFLGLAALVAVLLGGVAIALSSRRFARLQADTSALLRCLGSTRHQVLAAYSMRLLGIGLLTGLIGVGVGFASQQVLANLIGHWFTEELPAPGINPLIAGMGVGLITLLGFGLPPLLRLGSVSPLRVLRRDLDPPAASFWLALAAGLAALSVLTFWQTADARLSAVVLGSFLGTLGVLLLAARGLVFLLTRMRGRDRGLWAYGLDSLARDPATCSLQVAGLGLGILVLLLLGMVRLDLLGAWEASLPKDRPNQFALNIQPDEVDAVRDFLAANGLPGTDLYPMVRGRLTMINGRPVEPADYSGTRAKRLARREFNLSWADQMQSDNRVVQGQWWGGQSVDDSLFSVEQGLAETLGLELGDMLTFSVAGVPIEGRIASLRSVQWDSFNANFFVIATPTLLRDMPATYITSFYLSTDRKDIPARLVRNFPSVSVLDIESLIRQVREVMDRGALAVEYVFLFTLAAGLVVLYAGIQASREIRIQEAAILRTLGCNRRRLLVAVSVEFAVLGALASVIACSAAQLSGYLLATQVFDLPYQPDLKLWWVGLTAGTLGIAFSGILATYPLLARTPLNLLRRA